MACNCNNNRRLNDLYIRNNPMTPLTETDSPTVKSSFLNGDMDTKTAGILIVGSGLLGAGIKHVIDNKLIQKVFKKSKSKKK